MQPKSVPRDNPVFGFVVRLTIYLIIVSLQIMIILMFLRTHDVVEEVRDAVTMPLFPTRKSDVLPRRP